MRAFYKMVLPHVCFGLGRGAAVKIYGYEKLHRQPESRGKSR